MSGKLDITIEQGSDFIRYVYLTNTSDNTLTPRPAVDVSTGTFAGTLRKSVKSATPSATFTIAFVTDGTDGALKLSMDASTTSSLKAGKHVYDIEWTKANGEVVRLLEGRADVTQEVTK